jgi:hypothetical protein
MVKKVNGQKGQWSKSRFDMTGNDTLRRPQARDTGFYVPPETHVTSRGVERSGTPREVARVEGGRKTPFPSDGGGVMTFLYEPAT